MNMEGRCACRDIGGGWGTYDLEESADKASRGLGGADGVDLQPSPCIPPPMPPLPGPEDTLCRAPPR
jgi:hypothetical protein